MSNILLIHTTNHAPGAETGMEHDQPAHAALRNNIEALLETARPRLVRLARLHGVAPAAADDIVQETLLAAWRSLNHLRAPERFDAWLDGICRNMCRRWASAQKATAEQTRPLGALWSADERSNEMPDPVALDPAEELDRQDLEVLLVHLGVSLSRIT
jgi:RNA polymerase sigma factor (sigma-70 family)